MVGAPLLAWACGEAREVPARPAPMSTRALGALRDVEAHLGFSLASSVSLRESAASVHAAVEGDLELPREADAALEVADPERRVRARVRLEGTSSVRGELGAGVMVYAGGGPEGSDFTLRANATGFEDYVLHRQRPRREQQTYRIDPAEIPGLRLVDGRLELVDADGAPRLRVEPPLVIGAGGQRAHARVRIEGCAYDADPRAPWGRPVTAPGSGECRVVVDWSGLGIRYPALVDPSWVNAANLMPFASPQSLTNLVDPAQASTKALVVAQAGAALFDPVTRTFASTGAMKTPRSSVTGVLLNDGTVLFGGGFNGGVLATAELYSPATGTFAFTAGNLSAPRRNIAVAKLTTGEVLFVCGEASNGDGSTAWDLYNPTAKTFFQLSGGDAPDERRGCTATWFAKDKVLVAAGYDHIQGTATATAEIFDRESAYPYFRTVGGSMNQARYDHQAVLLKSGRVLLVGGAYNTTSVEVFIPGATPAAGVFGAGPQLSTPRRALALERLSNDWVLAAGGFNAAAQLQASAEIIDPALTNWSATASMNTARANVRSLALAGSAVLVAGATNGAELWLPSANGAACPARLGECASGICADGVCCDTACTGLCQACTAALKGTGANGSCGFIGAGQASGGDCVPSAADPCGKDGTCDGAGSCRTAPPGAAPAAGSCPTPATPCGYDGKCNGAGGCRQVPNGSPPVTGTCTNATNVCASDGNCDGFGGCKPAASGAPCGSAACKNNAPSSYACSGSGTCDENVAGKCDPFLCQNGLCPTTCASDADCVSGAFCDGAPNGTCKGQKTNGTPCTNGAECSSTQCVDGFCCDQACGEQCLACDVTGKLGTCSPVTGEPHGVRPKCAGAGATCGGTCDGQAVACAYPTEQTACGQTSCKDGVMTGPVCDALGACNSAAQPVDCKPYVCADAVACRTNCEKNSDCSTGFACSAAKKCEPSGNHCEGNDLVDTEGKKTACAPYVCEGSACKTTCDTIDDCVAPSVCNAQGKCVKPAGGADDGGCGCRTAARRSTSLPLGLVLGLLSSVALRRKKKRNA